MTPDVTTIARDVSDLGMMAVSAAFFLTITALMWVACFKWFRKIIDDLLSGNARMIQDLLSETRKQNEMLNDISEGLRPETLLRVKNMSGAHFDLAVERACRLIERIKTENHITDRERTKLKIRTLVGNLHEERKSKFDSFSYRGKRLSDYFNPQWVEWVEEIVENEVYDSENNRARAYTNVKAVYEKIKMNFYNRLK